MTITTRWILPSVVTGICLAASVGCKTTPGGGPLRPEILDHPPVHHRAWIDESYCDPKHYCYHQTTWREMRCTSACGPLFPPTQVISEVVVETPLPAEPVPTPVPPPPVDPAIPPNDLPRGGVPGENPVENPGEAPFEAPAVPQPNAPFSPVPTSQFTPPVHIEHIPEPILKANWMGRGATRPLPEAN